VYVNLFLEQYALEQEQDKVKAKQYAEPHAMVRLPLLRTGCAPRITLGICAPRKTLGIFDPRALRSYENQCHG